MKIIGALAIALLFGAGPHEHKIGSHVMFGVTKEHRLMPMLPVELAVVQEEGPIADGALTCDVVERDHDVIQDGENKIAAETVLRCNGGRVFVLKQIVFSASR